jgi:hypothetical protein
MIHEVFLQLVDERQVHWEDRTRFLSFAARIVRDILVERARPRVKRKRPHAILVTFDTAGLPRAASACELVKLDQALESSASSTRAERRWSSSRSLLG